MSPDTPMPSSLPDSRVMRPAAPQAPQYELRSGASEAVAQFAGGTTLRVDRTRERYYPGLAGIAPPTLSLYDRALGALGGVRRVLDAGCGAGAGTQLACQRVSEVIGIDKSQMAIQFARNMAPDAKLLVGDLTAPLATGTVDAAIAIDVLGHLASPEAMLVGLRGALPLGRKIYIAEASAFPAQCLASPSRRGFSKGTLASLLANSGYEILSWEQSEGPFLACVASPFSDPAWDALRRGIDRATMGDAAAAEQDLALAKNGSRTALAVEAWLAEAALGFAQRNGDKAIQAFFKVREMAPEDPRPLAGLARIALAMGDVLEASQFAAAAERLDPTEVDVACTAALVAERARPQNAKAAWHTASNLAPDSLDVALRLADLATARREPDLAVWALERVRSYADDHGTALHIALAAALDAAGRQADAMLELQLAQKISPDDPAVADWIARLKS
ncbi:MAG: methyltransferase domain-containing protein [Polyangiaceae bacterium]